MLARCIAAAGGSDEPVPLAKLEPIVAGAAPTASVAGSWTLARALDRRGGPMASGSSASPAACRCRV